MATLDRLVSARVVGYTCRVEHVVHVEGARGGRGADRALYMEIGTGSLVALADGVGGRGGGAAAAERVIASLVARAPRLDSAAAMVEALAAIDGALFDDRDAGETTAVALCVAGGQIFGASVGDSEAIVLHGARFDELTCGQRRRPVLGSGQAALRPFVGRLAEGTLVVASDGLFKYVSLDVVRAACSVGSLRRSAQTLADAGRLRSGALPDDRSFVLLRAAAS
ncbi:MAG: hypothetical protein KC636_14870 [Myxococcales bacterium]|nr:hypothetical protein [Myxococcales bacterium]